MTAISGCAAAVTGGASGIGRALAREAASAEPSARARIRASASSRPSSMPIALRRNTVSARSSFIPTVTSTGSGTTPGIRRGLSRVFIRRTNWR